MPDTPKKTVRCPVCRGRGEISGKLCELCKGTGEVRKDDKSFRRKRPRIMRALPKTPFSRT